MKLPNDLTVGLMFAGLLIAVLVGGVLALRSMRAYCSYCKPDPRYGFSECRGHGPRGCPNVVSHMRPRLRCDCRKLRSYR